MADTLTDIQVDPVLTNISVMHALEADSFVHHRVFPIVPVTQEDGFYFRWNRDTSLRTEAQERRPGTPAAQKLLATEKVQLALKQWALETPLPDEFRSSADSPYADEAAVVAHITQDLLIRREKEFLSSYVNAGGSTPWANTDVSPSTAWNAASGATPIEDVKDWCRTVQLACGLRPNGLLLSQRDFDAAAENANVISRLQDTNLRDVTKENLAALMGLDEVVVSSAVENTAAEGVTYSGSYVMTPGTGLLYYKTPTPARLSVSAGYIFSWSEYDEVRADIGNSGGAAILRYRREEIISDMIRGRIHMDHGIVADSAAVRLTSLTS